MVPGWNYMVLAWSYIVPAWNCMVPFEVTSTGRALAIANCTD